MPPPTAHHSFWKTSDFFAVVAVLLGLLLQTLWPLSADRLVPAWPRIALGIGLGAAAVVLIVLARRELRRHQQPAAPDRPTTRIVDTGVYRRSRNPIYLGLVAAFVGLGLALDVLWWVVLSLPLAVAIQQWLVGPEERYLLSQFDADYAAYQRRVRRWL